MAIYTQLSLTATPGKRYPFLDKTAKTVRSGGRQFFKNQAIHHARLKRDDKDALEIIIQSFISEIFY